MRKAATVLLAAAACWGCADVFGPQSGPRNLDLIYPRPHASSARHATSINGSLGDGGDTPPPPTPPSTGGLPAGVPADWPDVSLIISATTKVGFEPGLGYIEADMDYRATTAMIVSSLDVTVAGASVFKVDGIRRGEDHLLPGIYHLISYATVPVTKTCGTGLFGKTDHEAHNKFLVNWSFVEWGGSAAPSSDRANQPPCATVAGGGGGGDPFLDDWYLCTWDVTYANAVIVAITPRGCEKLGS
jgi:hypothetical protein